MPLTSPIAQPFLLLAWLLPVAVGCSSSDSQDTRTTTAAVCLATVPADCPDPAPAYADVAPIFTERCASCHTEDVGAPWPLDTYERVTDWTPVVRDDLLRCTMPPSDSDVSMTSAERQRLLTWIDCGAPE
jgi:uncharacterized membrane protein